LVQIVHVVRVDHASESIARDIHAAQMSAYAQEAKLLGVIDFHPLRRTVEDIRTSYEEFIAAYCGEQLVGAISVQSALGQVCKSICSLVVSPEHQRHGIARQLLATVLRSYGHEPLAVQTGAKNRPALSLYTQFGFLEYQRWLVGQEPLELVELRRPPTVTVSVPENAA
jgi:GNAT superfamily N-acetyltransferase